MNTHQEQWAIPEIKPSQTSNRGGKDIAFLRVLKNVEIKKEVEFPWEC